MKFSAVKSLTSQPRYIILLLVGGLWACLFLTKPTTSIRAEIETKYAQIEFGRGELLSQVAPMLTFYGAGEDGADLKLTAPQQGSALSLTTVTMDADRHRMSIRASGNSDFELDWRPQSRNITIFPPGPDGDGFGAPTFVTAINDGVRLGLQNPSSSAVFFRTRQLQSVRFVPPSDETSEEYSELYRGELTFSELSNDVLPIGLGEHLYLDFSEPTELAMYWHGDTLRLAISGVVDDVRIGSESAWSAMPTWFQYLANQHWAQAIAAFLTVVLVPIFVEVFFASPNSEDDK